MAEKDDMELLREYALERSEPAFATIVSRHIDLVYAAAWRHIGNHHQAEEITQAVFIVLARKAGSLRPGTVLPGWLFQTTRLTAANYLRAEVRRTRREQEAFMESNANEENSDPWQQVAPLLNDVIGSLGEKDRNAVVLRFFKGKDYAEVAANIGGTAEAAQMRVTRALEKLRKLLGQRGVVLSAAALGGMMAASAAQAAPAGFAPAVAAAATNGAALTGPTLALVKGTMKIMAWTKVRMAVAAGVVALLAWNQHSNAVQTTQVAAAREVLRGEAAATAAQDQRMAELERQTSAITATRSSQEKELARLRARQRGAGAGGAAGADHASTTLLSATLRDPEARKALRTQLANSYRSRYSRFATEVNLAPDESRKLVEMAADGSMSVLDAVAAFTEGKISAQAALDAEAKAFQDATNQVRLKLGDDGLAKFEEDARTYPATALVEQFDRQLGPFPLSASQQGALAKIIEAEPTDLARELAGEIPVALAVNPDSLDERFAQESNVNQQIRERAAEFLAPDQVEALNQMQDFNMNAEKRNVLRMLRKL